MLKYSLFRPTVKYVITPCTLKLIQKELNFFFSSSIRMSGKSVRFGDKKDQNKTFLQKQKVIKTDDIDVYKILVSKEESHA